MTMTQQEFYQLPEVCHNKTGMTGNSHLGGCVYENPEHFLRSGYLKQLTNEACNELRDNLKAASNVKLRK